ncbi:molecular chaperone DnaK [Candidatus Azambacteria bacterium]|nr:molecular chaperone DnaK [Candidatus Azambacteria bacterium]
MAKILGIDLGTTNSAMAIIEGGEPKIIENKEGNRTTPSIIAISKSNDRLVGLLAKRQAVTNPKNTLFSIKRLIGRRFNDPEIAKDKKWLPYEIKESASQGIDVKMGDKWYTPQEISAMVLQKLKTDTEISLGYKIDEAIITVPAYFDDSQRQATKDAGEIAGFKVKRIINEPTAAALAYGFNKKKDEKIAVYDFGGGTFDVSILEIADDTIEVKATDGDTHLGGDDFDQKMITWLITEFKKDQGIDLTKDVLAVQRLKEAAEKAKHELSFAVETEINIPFITHDSAGPKHLSLKMTRAQLESLVKDLVDGSMMIVKRALENANFKVSDINEVILVGGQTRMPYIQESVKKFFGKEPNRSINPDEVVAIGAAIQGGILEGVVKDVLLLDVTPLSLGIETLGGVSTKIIEKNTTIPVSKSQTFSTAVDNQPSVEIHVLQGEREMAVDNKSLGRFILDGFPPSPRGVPQIEVTFDIDVNGIIHVKAKDKVTNKEQSTRIEAGSGLTKEQAEKMKREAEEFSAEDKKKRELAEARNAADNLIYTGEKTLVEFKDKIKEEDKKKIEEIVAILKKEKESGDADSLKKITDESSLAMSKIGAELYKEQASAKTPEPTPTPEGDQTQDKSEESDTKQGSEGGDKK